MSSSDTPVIAKDPVFTIVYVLPGDFLLDIKNNLAAQRQLLEDKAAKDPKFKMPKHIAVGVALAVTSAKNRDVRTLSFEATEVEGNTIQLRRKGEKLTATIEGKTGIIRKAR